MGDAGFDRDMADAEWSSVFARQAERADVLTDIISALEVTRATTVLEVGCGPGYPAIQLAKNAGCVIAIDQHVDAVRFCREKAHEAGAANVQCLAMDATMLGVCFRTPVAVVVGFVLHHAAAPSELLAEIGRVVPLHSSIFVLEYHPDGPGEVGPALEHRIPPGCIVDWLEHADWRVESSERLPEEKYGILAERA